MEGTDMQQAIALTQAIQILVNTRKQTTDVAAIWAKLNRAAAYLNEQLAVELA
jgi:hypothetical protein